MKGGIKIPVLTLVLCAIVWVPHVVYAESDTAPKKVRGLQVSEVKKRAVRISWKRRSAANYYRVQLRDSNNDVIKNWKRFTKRKKRIKKRHGHLKAGTTYNFRVKACNANGCSKWSKKKTFTTQSNVVVEPEERVDSAILALESAVHEAINMHREGQGLGALSYNSSIASIARDHSENMAASTTAFGHDGFSQRYVLMGDVVRGMNGGAENVAYMSDRDALAQQVANGWIASTGHRNNIEGSYTITGIGVAKKSDSNIYYFTQLFARQ